VQSRKRQLTAAGIAGLVLALALAVAADAQPSVAPARARPSRVLIISAPRLTWNRLLAADAPHLRRVFDTGAVASLAVRGATSQTVPAGGYGTLGAGNRTSATSAQEAAYGTADDAAIVVPDIHAVQARNDERLYGAQVGLLGQTLAQHGHPTAVVANADRAVDVGGEPTEQHRAAALALMDRRGLVPHGDVSTDLLTAQTAADLGEVTLDRGAVARAFDRVWTDRAVVLVELSDLERADAAYDLDHDKDRKASDRAVEQALAYDDAIVGDLLARTRPGDLVIVVSPVAPRWDEQLTPFAVRGPGFAPGLLDSGTTQRAGFVALTDVGPTVLERLGVAIPSHMNGAGIRTAERTDPATHLRSLRDQAEVALFHRNALGPLNSLWTAALYVAVAVALLLLGLASWAPATAGRLRWLSELTRLALLGVAAYPIPSFLLGLFRYDELGSRTAVGMVLVAASGALALLLEAGSMGLTIGKPAVRRVLAPVLGAGLLLGLLVVDVALGAPMQLSTVFGYSPIGAGRFSGYGNQAYSFLAAAAVVVACGFWAMAREPGAAEDRLAWRQDRSARRALLAAALVFLLIVVADGAPTLGADVGGVLTTLPAAAVVLLLLAGYRVSTRRIVSIVVATLGLLAAVTAVDLARPADQQTHLGRLVGGLFHGGDSMGALSVRRKIAANLHILTSTWLLSLLGAVVALALIARLRPMAAADARVPGLRASWWGVVVVGVLAAGLNDSGVSMPATMAGIYLPFLLYVLLRLDLEPSEASP